MKHTVVCLFFLLFTLPLVAQNKETYHFWKKQGDEHFQKEEFEKAIKAYRVATVMEDVNLDQRIATDSLIDVCNERQKASLRASLSELWLSQANIAYRKGEYKLSFNLLRKAVEADSTNQDARRTSLSFTNYIADFTGEKMVINSSNTLFAVYNDYTSGNTNGRVAVYQFEPFRKLFVADSVYQNHIYFAERGNALIYVHWNRNTAAADLIIRDVEKKKRIDSLSYIDHNSNILSLSADNQLLAYKSTKDSIGNFRVRNLKTKQEHIFEERTFYTFSPDSKKMVMRRNAIERTDIEVWTTDLKAIKSFPIPILQRPMDKGGDPLYAADFHFFAGSRFLTYRTESLSGKNIAQQYQTQTKSQKKGGYYGGFATKGDVALLDTEHPEKNDLLLDVLFNKQHFVHKFERFVSLIDVSNRNPKLLIRDIKRNDDILLSNIAWIQFSPDSTQVIMAERTGDFADNLCTIHVWDFDANQNVLDIENVVFDALQRTPSLDIKGYTMACAVEKIKGEPKILQVFDLKNAKLAHELENYNPSKILLACESKKIVFVANPTNKKKPELMIWDWIENKVEELDIKYDPTAVLSVATDSRYLLSSVFDTEVSVYDLFSETYDKKIRVIKNCGGAVQEVQNYLLTNDSMQPAMQRLIKINIEGDPYDHYKKLYGDMTPAEKAIYKGFKL
jgi:tetratricopeptide (TPR) repeat protein